MDGRPGRRLQNGACRIWPVLDVDTCLRRICASLPRYQRDIHNQPRRDRQAARFPERKGKRARASFATQGRGVRVTEREPAYAGCLPATWGRHRRSSSSAMARHRDATYSSVSRSLRLQLSSARRSHSAARFRNFTGPSHGAIAKPLSWWGGSLAHHSVNDWALYDPIRKGRESSIGCLQKFPSLSTISVDNAVENKRNSTVT
jgi:hypothetical protein